MSLSGNWQINTPPICWFITIEVMSCNNLIMACPNDNSSNRTWIITILSRSTGKLHPRLQLLFGWGQSSTSQTGNILIYVNLKEFKLPIPCITTSEYFLIPLKMFDLFNESHRDIRLRKLIPKNYHVTHC